MKLKLLTTKITKKEAIIRLAAGIFFILLAVLFFGWYGFSEAYFSKNINEWKIIAFLAFTIYGIINLLSFTTGNGYKIKIQ